MSIDGLCKIIEANQLTPDINGTLTYVHEEWIELRLAFEEFIWDALDALDKLHAIEGELASDDYASTQDEAKVARSIRQCTIFEFGILKYVFIVSNVSPTLCNLLMTEFAFSKACNDSYESNRIIVFGVFRSKFLLEGVKIITRAIFI